MLLLLALRSHSTEVWKYLHSTIDVIIVTFDYYLSDLIYTGSSVNENSLVRYSTNARSGKVPSNIHSLSGFQFLSSFVNKKEATNNHMIASIVGCNYFQTSSSCMIHWSEFWSQKQISSLTDKKVLHPVRPCAPLHGASGALWSCPSCTTPQRSSEPKFERNPFTGTEIEVWITPLLVNPSIVQSMKFSFDLKII